MNDALFAGVKWKCTVCGKPQGICDCWVKCECGTTNQKGEECLNQVWHISQRFAQELAEEVVVRMGEGYRTFRESSVSGNKNIIGRLKRTIVRRAHPIIMSCFEGVESAAEQRSKEQK